MNKLKNKNLIYLITFFIICFITGCRKSKLNYINKKQISKINNLINLSDNSFKLGIEGIECKICARAVIDKIRTVHNVENAELIYPDNNFENCYVIVYLKNTNKNINIEEIKNELKKDGFLLKFISGEFMGHYFFKDKNISFKFDDLNITVKVKSKIGEISQFNKSILVKGKLDFQNDLKEDYILYLN